MFSKREAERALGAAAWLARVPRYPSSFFLREEMNAAWSARLSSRKEKKIYIYKKQRKKKKEGKRGGKRALSSLRVKSRSNYEHLATSNLLLGGLNAPIHACIYIFLWSPVCGAGERNAQKVVVQIPSR